MQRSKVLKVCKPNGEKIRAFIFRDIKMVTINVQYLEEVKRDNPPFAKNGIIRFSIPLNKYKEALDKLVKYLEDLFLVEIGKMTFEEKDKNNEALYSSFGVKSIDRGNKGKNTERKIKPDTGKRNITSVYGSSRRKIKTESVGDRSTDTEMAENDNTQINTED